MEDTDDFYDLEEEIGAYIVKVDGILYQAICLVDVCPYGFEQVLPKTDENIVAAYWYNGGAGVHEVLESAIKKWRKETAAADS